MLQKVPERKFQIHIARTEGQMGMKSGDELIGLLEALTTKLGCPAFLNLAAAPSQNASYLQVVKQGHRVDWTKVTIGHLDEFFELPKGHPNTFQEYLKEHFTKPLEIPQNNVFFIKDIQTKSMSLEKLAKAYGKIISQRIHEVQLGRGAYISHIGYGVNGHMAFNEPHVDKWTDKLFIPVELEPPSVQQQFDDYKNHKNPAARYKTLEDVPKKAVTMSMSGLLASDYIICVVPGLHKTNAVKGAIDGELTDTFPASMSRLARDFRSFLTEESASKLQRKPKLKIL